ncbi:MAG: hypothetical protein ACKOAD_07755 [Gammaproteobacteria bacterium]
MDKLNALLSLLLIALIGLGLLFTYSYTEKNNYALWLGLMILPLFTIIMGLLFKFKHYLGRQFLISIVSNMLNLLCFALLCSDLLFKIRCF